MFAELASDMKRLGWDADGGVAATEVLWTKDFRDRKIIEGFMKGERRSCLLIFLARPKNCL